MKHLVIEGVDTDIYVEYKVSYTNDSGPSPYAEEIIEIEYAEMRYFNNNQELCNTVDITDEVCYDFIIDHIKGVK